MAKRKPAKKSQGGPDEWPLLESSDEPDDTDISSLVSKTKPLQAKDLLGFAKLVITLFLLLFTVVCWVAIWIDPEKHLPTILNTVFSWVPAVIALVLGYYFGQIR